MIKPALTEIALFVAPFVLYAAFLVLTTGALQSKMWTPRRLFALTIVSLLLVIGSFLALAQFSGAPPGSTYIPAHMDHGGFVPGETR
jgi:Family of unknown function (DUF6111)